MKFHLYLHRDRQDGFSSEQENLRPAGIVPTPRIYGRGGRPHDKSMGDISLITYLDEAALRHGQPVKAVKLQTTFKQGYELVELPAECL